MADYQNPKASNAILGDLQEIVTLIQSGAKMDPSGNTNIPNGAKRVVSVTGGYQIQSYNGSTWVSIGKLIHDCDTLDGKNSNTGTTANTIPVRDKNGDLPGDITGNAATATKLATARTIDLGGIVSATEQSFDGSKPITIPVNSINVNNENDDAVKGVLTPKHGGTGRTDGAAADVVVSSAQGTVKASAYGQIGDAKNINGTDLDTLTVSGNYISTSGTIALHYPYASTSVVWRVNVCRQGTSVRQILFTDEAMWTRQSTNTGGSWTGWLPSGTTGTTNLILYVSKSGNDNNTGTDSANPVLTINRAIRIAKGWYVGNSNPSVILRIGEGDWGAVTFNTLPFRLYIYPYDGAVASAYSSSLPTFTNILSSNSVVSLLGVVIQGAARASVQGYIGLSGYNRIATVHADNEGVAIISSSESPLDILSANQQYVLRATTSGYIYAATRTINVVENLNLSNSFISGDRGGTFFIDLLSFTLADSVSVTGSKISVQRGCSLNVSKTWISNNVPGTTDAGVVTGVRLASGIWGGGNSHYIMGGDAMWREDASYLYARDVAVAGNTDDLASARGQIGQAPSLSATDWNTLTKSGVYWFSNAAIQASENAPTTSGGHLVVHGNVANYVHQFYYVFNTHTAFHRCCNNGTWGTWKQLLDANGNFPNNAATASKLYTARDITLTGQVTGSASFDGSGDTSITTYNGAYASAVVEGEAQENSWFKIADTMDGGSYVSFNIRFLVQRAASGGASFVWTISCMLNNGATEVQNLKSYITDIVNGSEADIPQDYFVATSLAGTNGTARVALWVNIPSRFNGYKFTVLGETSRWQLNTTRWNLYHLEKEDGVTEIPSSYTSVPTQFFTPERSFAVGDFCWSYRSSKTGFLLCNGAAISRTTYADLYAIIGTKFGTGDGSTTFNLPDMRGKVAWGANGNLGTVLAAGLPNATGDVPIGAVMGDNTSANAFWGRNSTSDTIRHGGANIYDSGRLYLDLSHASSIYGKSSTVQPPAIALNCFIKY